MAWPDFRLHNGSLHEQLYRKQQENDRKMHIGIYNFWQSKNTNYFTYIWKKYTVQKFLGL